MKLIDNAHKVLTQAWSVRFAAASSVLILADIATDILPFLSGYVPDTALKAIAAVCGILAVFARVVKQPKMRGEA